MKGRIFSYFTENAQLVNFVLDQMDKTRMFFAASVVLTAVISLVLIMLLRFTARFCVYMVVVLTAVTSLAATAFCWYQYAVATNRIQAGTATDIIRNNVPEDKFQKLDTLVDDKKEDVFSGDGIQVVVVQDVLDKVRSRSRSRNSPRNTHFLWLFLFQR